MPYKIVRVLAVTGILALFNGCVSAPSEKAVPPLVFPPLPEEPRYVFERSLRVNEDVEKLSGFARFKQIATGRSSEAKGLVKPYGVAVHQGRVYVTDTAQNAVLIFDLPGGRFLQFGMEEPGQLRKPIGIAAANDGTVYVCDISARRVNAYDKDGKYLRSIGDADHLQRPSGVALSTDGSRVYVVDTGGVDSEEHRVQVFSAISGDHLFTIGKRGDGPGEFNLPLQAATGPDGTLYVVDGGNFRVQAFTEDGQYKYSIGSLGRYPGQFARPKGIATDRDGNIYVVDTAFGNFQIFNRDGQLLLYIGKRGSSGAPATYMLPAGITVDGEGKIYIVDQFFRKVDIYRPADPSLDNHSAPAVPSN